MKNQLPDTVSIAQYVGLPTAKRKRYQPVYGMGSAPVGYELKRTRNGERRESPNQKEA